MNVNDYMARSAEAQERTAAALEGILKQLGQQQAAAVAVLSDAVQGNAGAGTAAAQGGSSPDPAAGSAASVASAGADDAGKAASASTAAQGGAQAASGGSASAGTDAKPPKIDDVRAALQVYAKREGNPAAMKLLESFGAKSVSAVPEDKWAELVGRCK